MNDDYIEAMLFETRQYEERICMNCYCEFLAIQPDPDYPGYIDCELICDNCAHDASIDSERT